MSSNLVFVGARTTPGRGTGIGISSFSVDADGRWIPLGQTPAVNPGALAYNRELAVLYAAHGDGNSVTAYRASADGSLSVFNTQCTEGTNPADIAISPDGRFLLAANHTSGSVVSLPLGTDGDLGPVAHQLDFAGTPGPHRSDQPGSKPHQVTFDPHKGLLFVPDKGLDTVFICSLSSPSGHIEQRSSIRLREFSGPRHIAFHPSRPIGYVVNELNCTVSVLDYSQAPEHKPICRQVYTTLPVTDVRDHRAAEICVSPDGRWVFTSNRSGAGDKTPGGPDNDTVAVFRIAPNGDLEAAGHKDSGGIRPRFMTVAPNGISLVIANEVSGTINMLSIPDSSSEPWIRTDLAKVASGVNVLFA